MDLHDLYDWCNDEWGKPLVIHPQGYGIESYQMEVGGEPSDCYWAVLESNGKRSINFIISATKIISEAAGPLVYDCPEWFFDLVPEVVEPDWRNEVKKFWLDQANSNRD